MHDPGHILVGFGFGPIQAGLIVAEAFKSGRFERLVVAEIDDALVQAIRANGGSYAINVAYPTGIVSELIEGIDIYNPLKEPDRGQVVDALSQSTEMATSLPSVSFYDTGACSVASLIAQGLQHRVAPATVIYTAENNNHAAEILQKQVEKQGTPLDLARVQFLNTVIGKMSQVVTDPVQIERQGLQPIAPGIARAFLVESFNRIMVTKTRLPGFRPGIEVFAEKHDLMPFEEAKLYGHNAIHALLAYLADLKGYTVMSELSEDKRLMAIARTAFIEESGGALIKKYSHLNDELFTPVGYAEFADDLLTRMTNPHLCDAVDRAGRDVLRKLGAHDRIFGTMRMALAHGIEPRHMALGAGAALCCLQNEADSHELPADLRFGLSDPIEKKQIDRLLQWIWKDATSQWGETTVALTHEAMCKLKAFFLNQ